MKAFFRTLTCFALLCLTACDSGPARGTVLGKVTLDGKPLASGSVRFVPLDGKSPTAGAQIKDGAFTAEVPVGDMRVEFNAPRSVGKKKEFDTPQSEMVDIVVEAIPARYNQKSELTMTVQKGSNPKDFELQSR